MALLSRFNDRASVGIKIGVLLGVMLLVAGVNVGVVYYYQSQVSTISNSVNYAGQQRMLSQQMARYSNNLAQTESETAREGLRAAMEKYDRNLKALKEGGTINGDQLSPAPSDTKDELAQEQDLWKEYKGHVQVLLNEDPDSQKFQTSLSYIQSNSNKLLTVSDDATGAFATVSNSKISFMQQLLLILFAFNIGVFFVGTLYGRRYIGNPIDELTQVAERLAKGDLDTDVESEVTIDAHSSVDDEKLNDELKQLVGSFAGLQNYLTTVADQAEALADQEFDAQVLNEDVPGEFGETLARMRADLQTLVDDLESLNEQLENKAKEYQTVMEQAAAGDLTQRMDTESESQAMVNIGETFNEMMAELEGTIAEIREFADQVAKSSQQVTASTEEVQTASEQVSESVQEISAGAERQNENLEEVASEMQSLSGTIEEVAASSDQVAQKAQKAAEIGSEGSESANEAIEDMAAIESKAVETVDEVELLAEEMDEISEIVDMITEIAEQTNLLALNASIEAARVGEAGEGFAVVADEIKSLAEDAASATEQIESLITDIQSSTSNTVEDMREMGDRVSSGTVTIEDALSALDEIVQHVDEANGGIQEISEAADDQATSTEEVVSMVDEVTEVAQQTSNEAGSVSAAAEEQTSSLSEVTQNIQAVNQRADDLQEMLKDFSVSAQKASIADSTTSSPQVTADGGTPEGAPDQ